MAGITKEDLRREITAIFKDADLTSMSAKKLRQQLEKKLDIDLSERKKEVDDIMMECLQEKRDGKSPKSESKKRKDADEDDEEEEEEEEDEEDDEEEEKAKRSASKKKPPAKKQKKGSSDESDEGSDDNASDEEYSPAGKKGKGGGGRKGSKGGKKKAKGSDSDEGSDEDWAKSRRGGGGGGGGGGNSTPAKKAAKGKRGGSGGGGAYTRAYNLTPELAALVGSEAMARHEVVKKIWAIIKGRNLFDPKNKQFAICDDELLKVFGVKRFRTFGMMKYLKNHFVD